MTRRIGVVLLSVAVVAAALAGCGGEDGAPAPVTPGSPTSEPAGEAPQPSAADLVGTIRKDGGLLGAGDYDVCDVLLTRITAGTLSETAGFPILEHDNIVIERSEGEDTGYDGFCVLHGPVTDLGAELGGDAVSRVVVFHNASNDYEGKTPKRNAREHCAEPGLVLPGATSAMLEARDWDDPTWPHSIALCALVDGAFTSLAFNFAPFDEPEARARLLKLYGVLGRTKAP